MKPLPTTIRLTEELDRILRQAADHNGVSITREIKRRLSASLNEKRRVWFYESGSGLQFCEEEVPNADSIEIDADLVDRWRTAREEIIDRCNRPSSE